MGEKRKRGNICAAGKDWVTCVRGLGGGGSLEPATEAGLYQSLFGSGSLSGFNGLGMGGGYLGGIAAPLASAGVGSSNGAAVGSSPSPEEMYIVESADGSPPSMVLVGIVSLFHWMSSFSDDNPDPGGTLSVRETLAEVAAAIGDWGIDSGVGMTVNMVCVACKFIEPPGGYGKWIRGQFGSHAGNSEVYDDVRLGLAVAELAVSLRLTKVPRFSRAACFGAGTLVVTHDGLTPIEEVDIGDLVWARDDETGEEGWKPVVQVVATPDKETLALTFEAADGTVEVVRVTAEHPLWSLDDGGWDEAGHLDLGEQVDALHGPMWLVSAVLLGDTQTVYNLEVADSHTYFVGDVAIWAHNTCWLNIAKHAGKRIPGADLTQKARYLETFANTATGTTTQTGATIWRRGAEILVVRPGVGSGGTYRKADSAKTALRQLQRFIIDNGGAAL